MSQVKMSMYLPGQQHRSLIQQLAPLASLDCSITEPITESHTSTTDTPTLSGYFECDQLSDMLDDSLFEITNVGCLSKSVFTNQTFKQQQQQQQQSLYSQVKKDTNLAATSGTRKVQQEATYEQSMSGQLALLANYPASNGKQMPVDEAATTCSTFRAPQGAGKAARSPGTASNKVAADQDSISALPDKKAADRRTTTRRKSKNKASKEEQSSDPSVLPADLICSACEQEATFNRLQSNKRSLVRPKKHKKSRFSFGLFNLFNTNNNNNNNNLLEATEKPDDNNDTTILREPCRHLKNGKQQQHSNSSVATITTNKQDETHRVSHRNSRSNRLKAPLDTNSSSTQIRSRDSIKFTRQQRQRINSNSNSNSNNNGNLTGDTQAAIQLSKSCTDFNQATSKLPATEVLLLDPSDGSSRTLTGSRQITSNEQQANPLRGSHSSYLLSQASDRARPPELHVPGKQRQIKSVKFSVPDKVMSSSSSTSATNSSSIINYSSKTPVLGSSILPAPDLLPLAPIIKRANPKSSSYSQTDSSKNLDELLARYEGNHELIREINEKLKLTETIASPMSALDEQQQVEPKQASASITSTSESNVQLHHPASEFMYLQQQPTVEDQLILSADDSVCHDSGSSDPISMHSIINQQPLSSDTILTTDTTGYPSECFNKQRAIV